MGNSKKEVCKQTRTEGAFPRRPCEIRLPSNEACASWGRLLLSGCVCAVGIGDWALGSARMRASFWGSSEEAKERVREGCCHVQCDERTPPWLRYDDRYLGHDRVYKQFIIVIPVIYCVLHHEDMISVNEKKHRITRVRDGLQRTIAQSVSLAGRAGDCRARSVDLLFEPPRRLGAPRLSKHRICLETTKLNEG